MSYDNFVADEKKLLKILEGDAEELVKYANELGEEFAPQNPFKKERDVKLSSSQIRNILDDVQRMKEYNKNELYRIRPKLAYVAGRSDKDNVIRKLQKILDKAIELVAADEQKSKERFSNFKEFFEAIVGYHRYHSKVKEA